MTRLLLNNIYKTYLLERDIVNLIILSYIIEF